MALAINMKIPDSLHQSLAAVLEELRIQALAKEKDPRNRFLWNFSRRRLEAEEMRDAMLQAAGLLNPERFGPSVIAPIEPELVNLLYKPDQWAVTPDAKQHSRRSVYLFQKRNMRMPFMEVFDSPDTLLSCARRESSTHAPQALELLNGPLTRQASVALAERLTAIGGSDAPGPLKTLQKVPVLASFVGELLAMFFSPVKSTGSADLVPEVQAVY